MASNPFFKTLRKALAAYYETSNWQVMLLLGYAENTDLHEYASEIEVAEVSPGGGYVTGGLQLPGTPLVTYTPVERIVTVTFPELIIPSATITATHAVYKKELGQSSIDELGLVNVFGGLVTSTNGSFVIPAASFSWDFPN
jgi:hypothetical protein